MTFGPRGVFERFGRMQRAGWLIGGLLAATLALNGCGVRGGLEQSEEAKAAIAAEKATQKGAVAVAKPGDPVPPKPHKPFVLDGLIR
jgi:predicted small lipoprotein YifL